MRLPTIGQYVESVAQPFGLFRTLRGYEAERDMFGEVRIRAGNNAAVFRLEGADGPLALKCYIKQGRFTKEIYDYLRSHPSPLLAGDARRLCDELFVYDHCERGRYYDVTVAEWVEGESLDRMIRSAALREDRDRLQALAGGFDRLALGLLAQEWAHGDLKPENIVVREDGTQVLVDYDAMFIPPLAGEQTQEVGTLNYQHPLRDTSMYDKHIDDYSIVLISTSLHALALDPGLYLRFNDSDNILLSPAETVAGRSAAYDEIVETALRAGRHALVNMARTLTSPVPVIDRVALLLHDLAQTACGSRIAPEETCLFERNGKWGYAGPDGRTVIEPIYEDAAEFSEGLASVRLEGRWSFIDVSGRVEIDCGRYERVQSFHEGRAAVRRNGAWGYIDIRGEEVIAPEFEIAGAMREGAAVVKQGGLYGYIDRDGRWIITPRFEYAVSFRNGTARVQKETKTYQIDKSGRTLYVIA